ncbi:MAG: hypothetical protein KTR14_01150 [Vampirovibrio sp.]|nr:hypothetical protein [Vampirovibrio sp.]
MRSTANKQVLSDAHLFHDLSISMSGLAGNKMLKIASHLSNRYQASCNASGGMVTLPSVETIAATFHCPVSQVHAALNHLHTQGYQFYTQDPSKPMVMADELAQETAIA